MTSTQTMIKAFGLLFVIGNSLGLGLKLQIGQMLAEFFRHWRFAAKVLLINFVILPGLIIGFAAIVHIPADIKIGYCIVALAAGAPFAPMLTQLAKGDVSLSTNLFVVLVVVTTVVVPLALSPAVTALVPAVPRIPIWDVAWPLLLFLLLPLLIGCLLRLRYPVAQNGERPLLLISLTCLLLYTNVFVVANWHSFVTAWGSGTLRRSRGRAHPWHRPRQPDQPKKRGGKTREHHHDRPAQHQWGDHRDAFQLSPAAGECCGDDHQCNRHHYPVGAQPGMGSRVRPTRRLRAD